MKAQRLLEMSDLEIQEYINSCHLDNNGSLNLTHFYTESRTSDKHLEWYAKFLRPIKLQKRFPIINSYWSNDGFIYLDIRDRSKGLQIVFKIGEKVEIRKRYECEGNI